MHLYARQPGSPRAQPCHTRSTCPGRGTRPGAGTPGVPAPGGTTRSSHELAAPLARSSSGAGRDAEHQRGQHADHQRRGGQPARHGHGGVDSPGSESHIITTTRRYGKARTMLVSTPAITSQACPASSAGREDGELAGEPAGQRDTGEGQQDEGEDRRRTTANAVPARPSGTGGSPRRRRRGPGSPRRTRRAPRSRTRPGRTWCRLSPASFERQHADEQVAGVGDRGVRQQPLDVGLGDRQHRADQHGQHRHTRRAPGRSPRRHPAKAT